MKPANEFWISNKQDEAEWDDFLAGNLAAISHLYHRYYNDLYHYGLAVARDEKLVEDTIQALFCHFIENRERLNPIALVKSYFLRCMANNLRKELTKRDRNQQLEVGEIDSKYFQFHVLENLTDDEDEKVTVTEVANVLNGLPDRQRMVMVLKFYENMGYQDIADTMEINYQSVLNLANKAKKALLSNSRFRQLLKFRSKV